jgi:hypothetical protein
MSANRAKAAVQGSWAIIFAIEPKPVMRSDDLLLVFLCTNCDLAAHKRAGFHLCAELASFYSLQ